MPGTKELCEPSVPEKVPVVGTATPRQPSGAGNPSQARGPGDIMQGRGPRGEEVCQLYWSLVLRNVWAQAPEEGRGGALPRHCWWKACAGPVASGGSSPTSWVRKHRYPGAPAWGLEAQMPVALAEAGASLSF